jgi:5-methylthioadenosine/S-adenosylhomocysteine deaminase
MIVTADWVVPVCEPPIRHGAIAVREGVVVEVGAAADVCARWMDDTDAAELDGCIVAPGLVNAHTHLSLTALRGLTVRAPLPEWLPGVTRAVLGLSHEEFGASAALGALELLMTGTTAVGDIVYGAEAPRAATTMGLGGAFAWEVLGIEPAEMRESLARRGFPSPDSPPAWDDETRAIAAISPHSPYTSGPSLLQEAHRFARSHGIPFIVHAAESAAEVEVVATGTGPFARNVGRFARDFEPTGMSPVAYLDSLGVLDDAVVVHAVHVDDDDIALLAAKARGVVLDPRSNEWLSNGPAPVAAMRAAGVRLAIGTDSLGSNADLDLFAEMRTLRTLDRTITPDEALWMMTLAGAQLLGMAGSLGAIAPGVQADLVAVRAHAGDDDDPVEALLTRGSAGVEDVLVAGEWRIRDCGPTFDAAAIEAAAAPVAAHAAELVTGSGPE